MKCDCDILEFVKSTKIDGIKTLKNNFKLTIDDVYCDSPKRMTKQVIKSLDPNDIKCIWTPTNIEDACKNICTCWEFSEEHKIFADCSQRGLTNIPTLVGKYNEWAIELNLSGNRIKRLPSFKNDTFKKIKLLDLSNNSISSISTDIFSEFLQVLNLHDNNISKFSYSLIQYLEEKSTSLTNLTLYNNPWICDCDTEKLTQISFIRNSINVNKFYCKNFNEFLFKLNFTTMCTHYFPYVIFGFVIILTILMLTIFCCLYYRQRSKSNHSNSFINKYRDEGILGTFISFSHGDGDFFYTGLVPKLERESKIPRD